MTHPPTYEWQGETLKPVQKQPDDKDSADQKDDDLLVIPVANTSAQC